MSPNSAMRWCRRLLGILVLIGLGWGLFRTLMPTSVASLLRQAQTAAGQGQWKEAHRLAKRAAVLYPHSAEAWILLAQSGVRLEQFDDAVDAWCHVPTTSSLAVDARLKAADMSLRELKQLQRAESLYREVIRLDPDNVAAVNGLAQLMAMGGRRRDLETQLLRLIQLDAYNNFHLDMLARTTEANVDPQLVPAAAVITPGDVLAQTARARLTYQTNQLADAKSELSAILQESPDAVVAQFLLGKVLLSQGDETALDEWLQKNSHLRHEPEYWRAAMAVSQRRQDESGSYHCAAALLNYDPTDVSACLMLNRGLNGPHESAWAATFLKRAQGLEQYHTAVTSARRPKNWDAMRQAATLAQELGLTWEAYGWSQLAGRLNPRLDWPGEFQTRLSPLMKNLPLVRTNPHHLRMFRIDPGHWREPQFQNSSSGQPATAEMRQNTRLHFEDQAESTGLVFSFQNGGHPLRSGLQKMYEMTGGGVGVLDFDGDHFPDLFFPQGGDFAQRGQPMAETDRIWQNVLGSTWRDVTSFTCIDDYAFGQGACAGDIDNDGFPDLLVLNIGPNTLWHNNGDGTFSRMPAFDAVAGDAWSLSAAIADFNNDAIPDIYVANYLAGVDVFERVCPDPQGIPRLTCQPLVFSAAADQMLLGQGDGTFRDVTRDAGIEDSEGRGMGVVVGRITQTADLDIFVANDATANFHFVRKATTDSSLRYENESFLLGTAVDANGRAQACMGIAVNDANGDGRFDLFVTNFEGESNTLYLQESGAVFRDQSHTWHVSPSKRDLLGFGTQFLDADLDGFPELLIANGHVNNRRDAGSRYQMPPSLLRNLDGQRFEAVPPTEAGTYFAGEYLGRGMATLDWNRDGLPDAAVAHLDRWAALLTNGSQRNGRWLSLCCINTKGARDSIGTIVRIQVGDRTLVRQLTGGDGYASSNQRRIAVGLGSISSDSINLQVEWPNGDVMQYDGIPVDHEIVIISGRPRYSILTP